MPLFPSFISARLKRLVNSWHPRLQREFHSYAASRTLPAASDRFAYRQSPYWLFFPRILARRFRRNRNISRRFLEDILWGQYALFLWIKLYDDLFDRHVQNSFLMFAGNELLLEAAKNFRTHFSARSDFWDFYHGSLRTTLRTILAGDEAQRNGLKSAVRTMKLYADGYSVCKVASFAACKKANRMGAFQGIAAASDELAVVGQLLDDVADMEADLERGRMNFALIALVGGRNSGNSLRAMKRRLRGMNIDLNRLGPFLQLLRTRTETAFAAIQPLGIAEANRYVDQFKRSVEQMDQTIHQVRVRTLLGWVGQTRSQ